MDEIAHINIDRLSADMARHVAQGLSDRAFSLSVTGGSNPSFYRHWKSGRQSTRLTANLFISICNALGTDVYQYVDIPRPPALPNEAVLTQAMAALLSSVGIDPYEGERARKIARQLPNVLQEVERLLSQIDQGDDADPSAFAHDPAAPLPVP